MLCSRFGLREKDEEEFGMPRVQNFAAHGIRDRGRGNEDTFLLAQDTESQAEASPIIKNST